MTTPTSPPRPGDRFDAVLYYGATIAAIGLLLSAGASIGFIVALWLFD